MIKGQQEQALAAVETASASSSQAPSLTLPSNAVQQPAPRPQQLQRPASSLTRPRTPLVRFGSSMLLPNLSPARRLRSGLSKGPNTRRTTASSVSFSYYDNNDDLYDADDSDLESGSKSSMCAQCFQRCGSSCRSFFSDVYRLVYNYLAEFDIHYILLLVMFAGIGMVFYFIFPEITGIWGNYIYQWFWGITIVVLLWEIASLIERLFIWLVSLTITSFLWRIYFFGSCMLNAFSYILFFLFISIIRAHNYYQQFSFPDRIDSLINSICSVGTLVLSLHVIRKAISKQIIWKINQRSFKDKIEELLFVVDFLAICMDKNNYEPMVDVLNYPIPMTTMMENLNNNNNRASPHIKVRFTDTQSQPDINIGSAAGASSSSSSSSAAAAAATAAVTSNKLSNVFSFNNVDSTSSDAKQIDELEMGQCENSLPGNNRQSDDHDDDEEEEEEVDESVNESINANTFSSSASNFADLESCSTSPTRSPSSKSKTPSTTTIPTNIPLNNVSAAISLQENDKAIKQSLTRPSLFSQMMHTFKNFTVNSSEAANILRNTMEARKNARILIRNLDVAHKGYITLKDFYCFLPKERACRAFFLCLPHEKRAEILGIPVEDLITRNPLYGGFGKFSSSSSSYDNNSNSSTNASSTSSDDKRSEYEIIKPYLTEGTLSSYFITRHEFTTSIISFCDERKRLSLSLSSWQSMTDVFISFSHIVFVCTVIFILIILYGDTTTVILPMTTLVLSFSFMFGNTVKSTLESVLFLFVIRPFTLGDRVILRSINGSSTNEYEVYGIQLLTTTFKQMDNKVVIIPNPSLMGMEIVNLSRSKNPAYHLPIQINSNVSAETLALFKGRLERYTTKYHNDWMTKVHVSLRPIESNLSMELCSFKNQKSSATATTTDTTEKLKRSLSDGNSSPKNFDSLLANETQKDPAVLKPRFAPLNAVVKIVAQGDYKQVPNQQMALAKFIREMEIIMRELGLNTKPPSSPGVDEVKKTN